MKHKRQIQYNNKHYILTKHAKEQLIKREINIPLFFSRDLNFNYITKMDTEGDRQIRYTKSKLKIILKGNVVISVFKCRPSDMFNRSLRNMSND